MPSNRLRSLSLTLLTATFVLILASCTSAAFGPEVLVTRQPISPADGAPLASHEAVAVAVSSPLVVDELTTEPAAAEATGTPRPSQEQSQEVMELPAESVAEVGLQDTEPTPEPSILLAVSPDPDVPPLQQTFNILLIGTDQADLEYVGRTDTIMVLALDVPNQRAALISIPRDIYLPIPGVGYSRINTAFAYGEERQKGGGIPLLSSTIERNFGIPIHNYVRIDFSGFKDVVDAVGGVDITVDCPIYDDLFWRFFGVGTLDKGEYHMTGEQALYYARSRKTTSDFDRARRQQQVLMAIRKRALDADLIPRVPALYLALKDIIDTDLRDVSQLIDLAKLGATMDSSHLYGLVLRPPLVNGYTTPQGAMVQIPDLQAIGDALDHIWERKSISLTNTEEKFCPMGE